MKVLGFVPGTWRAAVESLFVDSLDNGKYALTYSFIITAKGIRELREGIKDYAQKNDVRSMISPSRPSPRRLF